MLTSKLASALAFALLAGSLAACLGTPPTSGPLPKAPVQAFPQLLPSSLDILQANPQEGSDPLNLTSEQRRQLSAISQEAEKNDRSSEFQRVLLAPQIDVAALRSQLTATESDITQSVNMQLRIRNILTPQQRQTLVDNFRQSSQAGDGGTSESQLKTLQQQLSLTAEQTRLFTAMNDAMRRHTEANRTRLRDAQIALVQNGDANAFRQALIESNRTMPVDTMIAYFSNLSQAQRQKLFTESSGSSSGS